MSTLTQGDLRIECAVPITDIRSFHMEIRGNDHAVCHIEGTIPEAEGEEAILRPLAGTPVMAGACRYTRGKIMVPRCGPDDPESPVPDRRD